MDQVSSFEVKNCVIQDYSKLCNRLIGNCETKDTESFESMLLEDVGT